MGNTVYDNFYLSNEIEDQYNSHLNLQNFCTVDNTLTGVPGMVKKIHVYKASDGTEKLGLGEGNSKSINVGFAEREYRIELAQNRFQYFDEEAMTDPQIVTVGTRHAGIDMFNTVNKDIFAEFNKATLTVSAGDYTGEGNIVQDGFSFNALLAAVAKLNLETIEGQEIFAIVSPYDMAVLRTNMAPYLMFVTDYGTQGYIGTAAGVNIYVKKDATPGEMIATTPGAATLFNKLGVEVEQTRDQNIRQNTVYSRKYYLAALTDETKAVKILSTAGYIFTPLVDVVDGKPKLNIPGAAPDGLKFPTKGDNLYGKTVNDLIGADASIDKEGNVFGAIKHISGYKGFSSVKAEQSGNYFPIFVTAKGTRLKITKNSGEPKEVNLAEDNLIVVRVENAETTLKIEVDDREITTLKFTNANILTE